MRMLFSVRCLAVLTLIAALLLLSGIAAAQATAVWSFYSASGSAMGGSLPIGGLTADSAGNLYGVTFYGGTYGNGIVYKLSPSSSGWDISVLYSFNPGAGDGWGATSPPILDAAGNLYGTAEFGGTGGCGVFGCGIVYELTPTENGAWKETILHEFDNTDGRQIHAGLTMDASGNLYGVAAVGGTYNAGTVFELSPAAGSWTFSILHQFYGGKDGDGALAGLTFDAAGNLYGTTNSGGGSSSRCRAGCGVVYELSPAGNGAWTENILHNFITNDNDGTFPDSRLSIDAAGNLYGTTFSGGGPLNAGTVFELMPDAAGHWTEKVVHNFNEMSGDGLGPSNSLVFDASGNLYGATLVGGSHGRGTVFELSPSASGTWTETILNNFLENGTGYWPNSGPIFVNGTLFGINAEGGGNDQGTVFQLAP